MRLLPDILDELKQVRTMLLAPTAEVLRDCDGRLDRVIQAIRQSRGHDVTSREVKRLIQDIHLLLESAKKFWDARQFTMSPGQQYFPGGSYSLAHSAPKFAIEV